MKTEHHQKDVRTNSKGAIYDVDRELSGAENKGTYFDSENGRISSDRGNEGSWEKIRGEESQYEQPYTGDWFCMCSISVNEDVFEVWVEENNADSPYIVINNQVMGKSPDMPWLFENRIQFDKNENCIGGEVFLTDFNVAPMTFSVKDIKDAFTNGDLTYFDDFNPDLYFINLTSPLDILVFLGLENVGGGGGLPVGEYQYSLRYVNDEGDFTNWSPLTPGIPVLQSNSPSSTQYPYIKSFASNSDLANPTSFGVRLRYRVTNPNNYDFIEIRRIPYNTSAGIDVVPQGEIVARIDISDGEVSVREFLDPQDSNIEGEVLADNEEAGQLGVIEKAKAIRYYDKRLVLMNYETPERTAELNFLEYNGNKILPVSEDLGKSGFNDPVNHAYKKNYPSNEKFSFGINLFDGQGGSGFVVEDDDLKNVQAPSRRDPMSADSVDLSTGEVTAASVDSAVESTFEVFDHESAVSKTDKCTFKNIMNTGGKASFNVNEFCADAGLGLNVQSEEIGYQPYRPTNSNDTVAGHNYLVNPQVNPGSFDINYNPVGFGCNYYSRGFAIGGVDGFPSWAKSFSVVRSDRAGRVVCQGIGMYSLIKGDFGSFGNSAAATKEGNKLWFTSPDIASGLVNQSTLSDMEQNPQNYAVQFSSPLGFFSEVYNFEDNLETANRDRLIDMAVYARVLRDNGQINPSEDPAMGINGYVAYNRYRNTSNNPGQGFFNVPEGGNRIIDLQGFDFVADGRSSFFELELPENIYNSQNSGGTGDNDFEDQGMKDFTEPFYIVNIIRTGAEVPDLNIDGYYSTGHYQKLESLIGIGSGEANQSYILVDERWEDAIPALNVGDFNSSGESFIYLVSEQEIERTLFNVTFLTPAQVLVIMTDITNNGFYLTPGGVQVQGVYSHSIDINGDIFINFDNAISYPQAGEKIIIRYDSSRPIKFFGGDTTVGEHTFCPLDKESDGSQSSADEQFDFNIGFPFRRWKLNPRHYVARNSGTTVNTIQNQDDLRLGYIRQMILMYACESRISTSFSFNSDFPLEYFPMTHYIMRPNRFNDSSFESGVVEDIVDDNNLQPDYFEDYPEEYTLWKYGGFRFDQQYNIDFSVKGPLLYFSAPDVGFEEENVFCTGVAWSLPRAVNQQNSPGLKNFPAANRFIVDDDNGEIKRAFDSRTGGKGDNLYAINNSGVCLLLTKKAILSNLDSNDLTTTSVDTFIGGQYWLSREIGCEGEVWRGSAEGSVEYRSDSGTVERETLFFSSRESVYRLVENTITDIAKGSDYHYRIEPSLQNVTNDYLKKMSGHYDKAHNEYWLQIPDVNLFPQRANRCFVYDNNENAWVGRFHYDFDSYLFHDGRSYGFKDGEKFLLDTGFLINGLPIESFLLQFTSVNIIEEKEFISIEINTGPRGEMKPDEVIFFDEDFNELSRVNEALFGPSYLRQYSGWFNQIPRKTSGDRDRIQYRLILFRINHSQEEDFKVVSSVIQYKPMK